jgi:hypothetical protein
MRYCKEQGVDYATYVWTNESQLAAISECTLTVRDTTLYGSIYKEPEKPTEATVTICRYDGEEETVQTYTVAYGCRFETFVQENFWAEYSDSNSHEYEYAFFGGEMGGYQELTGSHNVWMIKRSVLEQGYNVSVDLTTRENISEKGEKPMYYPATLRQLVYEVTGWDIFLDGYYVLVNGESVSSSDKFDYIANFEERLYYRDVAIVVKPIFEINVEVLTQDERSKSKTLTYYGEVTPSQVALDLGLSRKAEDYLWKTGWSSDSTEYLYSVGEPLIMRLQWGEYLFVEARKVLVNLSIIIPTGEEMQFNTTSDMANNVGWEWSVSVQKAASFALGEVVGAFDDYRWSVKDEDGFVRSVTGDYLLNAVNKPYTGDATALYTVYTLIAVPKQVQVRVISYDTNGNEVVLNEGEYESGTTIGTLLSSLGFQKGDDNYTFVKEGKTYWMMVDLFSGYDSNFSGGSFSWQTNIDRSIRITLNVYS